MSTVEVEPLEVDPAVQAHGTASKTVVTCYSIFDRCFPKCGFFDMTDGMYFGEPDVSFDEAQANQHDYLLDRIDCRPGSRFLDVGCGYGTLLARARKRGASSIGITLSREQMRYGRRAGLDIRRLDYRAISADWDGAFDGIVANGSLEHFVQPADAAAGRADSIYRHFFQVIHRLLNRESCGRLVTTAIHFVRPPRALDLLRHPFAFRCGSDNFHFALLARSFGGWYPVPGQLERCADGYFALLDEQDGTEDYRRTSEEWLAGVRKTLRSPAGIRIALGAVPVFLAHPVQFTTMLGCMLASESWNWQFRAPNPPTRLLRQCWQYVPDGSE